MDFLDWLLEEARDNTMTILIQADGTNDKGEQLFRIARSTFKRKINDIRGTEAEVREKINSAIALAAGQA